MDETQAFVEDLLAETVEELDAIELGLVEAETTGAVNVIAHLFEVCRLIAGLAGSTSRRALAHTAAQTAELLEATSAGAVELSGSTLDLVFDAVAAMRRAVRGESADTTCEQVSLRLDALIDSLPLPTADPDVRLGELLVALGVPDEAVVAALERQRDTGRRLGEELLAGREVEPKVLAKALRSQVCAKDLAKRVAARIRKVAERQALRIPPGPTRH